MTVGTVVRRTGIRGPALEWISLGSVGLSIGLWLRAKTVDQDERGNAERRAIFVGLWPPMLWLIAESMRREGEVLKRRTEFGSGPDRHPAELARRLDALADLPINYTGRPHGRDDPDWHVDDGYAVIGHERPGPPEPDGPWERAGRIIRDYGFTDHRRLRGSYHLSAPLLHRDMMLEGRFVVLRFHLGVRVTDVVDGEADGHRIWGWTYETLAGHLEQGRLTYEVDKDLATGEVRFWIRAFSRRAPMPNPFYRFGFFLFGRAVQLGFYRSAGRKVAELVSSPPPEPEPEPGTDVVVAPKGSPRHWWDRVAVHVYQPGT